MTSTASPRRDARRNHERLLAEARALFAERGIDAPLDELARARRRRRRHGLPALPHPRRARRASSTTAAVARPATTSAPEILGRRDRRGASVELYLERLGCLGRRFPVPAARSCDGSPSSIPSYRPGRRVRRTSIDGLVARAQAEGDAARRRRPGSTSACSSTCSDRVGQYGGAYLPVLAAPAHHRARRVCARATRSRPRCRAPDGIFAEFHDMSHAEAVIGRNGSSALARPDTLGALHDVGGTPLPRRRAPRRGSPTGRRSARVRPSSRVGTPWCDIRSPSSPRSSAVGTTISTLPRPSARRRRPAPRAVPRVHRHVVVVAAGRDEERRAADASRSSRSRAGRRRTRARSRRRRPRGARGRRRRRRRRRRCRGIRCRLGEVLAQVAVRVEEDGGHLDLPVRPAPGRPVAIEVELDAVALGVGEVERLAHEVVGAAGERCPGTSTRPSRWRWRAPRASRRGWPCGTGPRRAARRAAARARARG